MTEAAKRGAQGSPLRGDPASLGRDSGLAGEATFGRGIDAAELDDHADGALVPRLLHELRGHRAPSDVGQDRRGKTSRMMAAMKCSAAVRAPGPSMPVRVRTGDVVTALPQVSEALSGGPRGCR